MHQWNFSSFIFFCCCVLGWEMVLVYPVYCTVTYQANLKQVKTHCFEDARRTLRFALENLFSYRFPNCKFSKRNYEPNRLIISKRKIRSIAWKTVFYFSFLWKQLIVPVPVSFHFENGLNSGYCMSTGQRIQFIVLPFKHRNIALVDSCVYPHLEQRKGTMSVTLVKKTGFSS